MRRDLCQSHGLQTLIEIFERWWDEQKRKKIYIIMLCMISSSFYRKVMLWRDLSVAFRVGPQGEFLQRGVHGRDVAWTCDFIPLWGEIDGPVAKLQPLSQFRPTLRSCFFLGWMMSYIFRLIFCWLEIRTKGWSPMQSSMSLLCKVVGPSQGEFLGEEFF